jgi:Angiotensin-converting enzyme.
MLRYLVNECFFLFNLCPDFTDAAEYWLDAYDTPDFRDQVAKLWDQIRPLYLQIHAYTRRRLNEKYGDKVVNRRGPIPAHLLGESLRRSRV